ncbi:proline iminopeptidase [Seinonella peptonophila]|uniref:Proline iminopeptidase n=1 Tax=Seinonella peptonophila TaxID=112248 RepID=A0A1M4ZWN6_9BACL|nr:alpha/beta hydrolase [Seinonella peptonophila]SHF22257.1 proline iminopeptidase [Seinonella peptonophila]
MDKKGIINIDGFELAYRIEGKGTPVLVVGSAVYYPQLFSKEIRKELKLIFIDHRGHVIPPRKLKSEDYTLDRILEDIETIRETLHLENFIILGHSGNAFLAFEYAIKYPTHVRKVILLNTAPTNSQERQAQSIAFFNETASPERKKKFEKDISFLANDIKKEPERRFAHMCIRMGAHSFYDYTFDAAYMWNGVYTSMQVIDYLWGKAFAQLNIKQSLTHLDKPVFLGVGKYDYLVGPFSLWDSIEEKFTNVRKVIFGHSGHNPMFEEPNSFNTHLIKWIYEDI